MTLPSIHLHFAGEEDEADVVPGRMAGSGSPFEVATILWPAVHGITSLRIAVPIFPLFADADGLLDHMLVVLARKLAPER